MLKIFHYHNPKDSNLGSLIYVVSDSKENAITLIKSELLLLEYPFNPDIEIKEIDIVSGLVIHSESGDLYV